MKKVLEIITLPSSAEAFIGNQFSFFQQTGRYEMHLICSMGDRLDVFAKEQGIKYKPVEISRQLAPWKDIKAIFQIAKYIRDNEIDIIIAHYFPKASLIATFANMLAGNRTKIMVAHGVLHDTMSGWKRKLVIWEQKFDVHFAQKVVCVSQSVARRRREDGIEKADKQVILGCGSCNGVDTQTKFNIDSVSAKEIQALKTKYGISEGDFVIGFSGRLVRDKGVAELQKAFELLKRKYSNHLKLFIIGQFEKRDALPQETVMSLKDNPDVVFTGKIPYSDIQKYYTLMDVLVLPSYREGFPTVVLEACAMGVPVVTTTSTGCIDSIVEHETGEYAEITPESLASKIELFMNKEFTLRMGGKAQEYIRNNFDQRIIRKYMLDVLDDVAYK